MYGKIFNFHFAMRVALGVRMMSSLWNSIDSFDFFWYFDTKVGEENYISKMYF